MAKLVQAQPTAVSQGEYYFVFEHARGVKKLLAFFLAQHHRKGVFFLYGRHTQSLVIHAKKPEPVAHAVNRKFKITLAKSVVGCHAIKIGVDFFGCQMLWAHPEMQCQSGSITPVIFNKAGTVLLYNCLLVKLLVTVPESGNARTGLLHQRNIAFL